MKFSVKLINKNGCRLGALSSIRSNPERIFETPLSLTITQMGSVPHLTKDVYNSNFNKDSILCIPTQHFANLLDVLQSYKNGIANFVSLQTHPVCVVVQDPTTVTLGGFNESSSVSTFSNSGRTKLTPNIYMDLISAMLPDWYETLNDSDTNASASKKRVEKSMNNSFKFFEKCRQIHESKPELKDVGLFAPLLGGHNPTNRRKWTKRILEEVVDGYCLLGLHENGTSAQSIDLLNLRECVLSSLENIPKDKIRQAQGAYSVMSVLEMVECGVDIFDCTLAFDATENGKAFCFLSTLESTHKEVSQNVASELNSCSNSDKITDVEADDDQSNKRIKIDTSDILKFLSEDEQIRNNGEAKDDLFEINLYDKRYLNCKEPILEGCKCYTCTTFTKSYLHHLLSSKEMLASVLLMIHNLHHWEEFFKIIRQSIKMEKFGFLKSRLKNYEKPEPKTGCPEIKAPEPEP